MTTLLIDGDVNIWRASSAVQRTFDFGGGVFAVGADYHRARDKFDSEIRDLVRKLKATRVVIALSDTKRNWRKEVMPTYKANRSHAKPKIFHQLREHVESTYDARWFPGLEGDDVLGLYATGTSIPGKKIVVSIDKDLQTVPGHLYNPNKPERGVRRISEVEADEYHLMQTLTGDAVDGYRGCPGVGPKRAAQALLLQFTPAERWGIVVRLYRQKGLDEADALANARVAHILRRGEYDKETYRVTLWTPPNSNACLPPPSATSGTRSSPSSTTSTTTRKTRTRPSRKISSGPSSRSSTSSGSKTSSGPKGGSTLSDGRIS